MMRSKPCTDPSPEIERGEEPKATWRKSLVRCGTVQRFCAFKTQIYLSIYTLLRLAPASTALSLITV